MLIAQWLRSRMDCPAYPASHRGGYIQLQLPGLPKRLLALQMHASRRGCPAAWPSATQPTHNPHCPRPTKNPPCAADGHLDAAGGCVYKGQRQRRPCRQYRGSERRPPGSLRRSARQQALQTPPGGHAEGGSDCQEYRHGAASTPLPHHPLFPLIIPPSPPSPPLRIPRPLWASAAAAPPCST